MGEGNFQCPKRSIFACSLTDVEEKIVFDRYHLMTHMVKAVDEIRKEEDWKLKDMGNELLSGTKYLAQILNYFRHRITNSVGEGLNSKIETIKKKAYGFRNREHLKIALYLHCEGLQLYPSTHKNVG